MLEQLSRHSLIDMTIRADGDLHIDDHHTVEDTGILLGQALANLVDNAIKYAPSDTGRPLKIEVSSSREGGMLALRVADNGVGVPEGDRERILQRFVRLEESRSQSGSGLGLSLVAAVARLHHGTIELSDNQPGLIVTIRLPTETG